MMKKILIIIIALLLISSTVKATTVRYSSDRHIVSPSLTTGTGNTSYVKDIILNYLTASTTVVSGSSFLTDDIEDVVYDIYTSATTIDFCSKISAYGSAGGDSSFPVTYASQNELVGTVDSAGDITYVGDGTTYFTASYAGRTRGFPCTFATNVGGTDYIFNDLVSGSLADHIRDDMDVRLTGLTPSATTQNIFSSSDTGTLTWVRNPNHLASTTDITSAVVYSTASGYQATGVLVAPDIILYANHTYGGAGTTIYFVTSTSTTVAKTVGDGVTISGTDIRVQRLTTPVTYGITPAKVLAENDVEKYGISLPSKKISDSALNYSPIPVIYTTQAKGIYVGVTPAFYNLLVSISIADNPTYSPWYRTVCCGDSGTPAYYIINDEAVLLGTWWSAYTVSNVSNYIDEINAAMTSLGSAYQLTTVDLSGFPTY